MPRVAQLFLRLELACPKSSSTEKNLSRKGAKAQSATAFLRLFFAPLRLCARIFFSFRDLCMGLSTFRAKPLELTKVMLHAGLKAAEI
jgi:hypothetical protein